MPSGLDSIALAVEHLERKEAQAAAAPLPAVSPPTTAEGPLAPSVTPSPSPPQLGPRMVSNDSLVTTTTTTTNTTTEAAAAAAPVTETAVPKLIPHDKPLVDLCPYYQPSTLVSYSNDDSPITQPGPHDVLCGRGGESNHWTGNVQYRNLVKACQPEYVQAKRRDKPRIAAGIVLAVRHVGGRFLKKQGDEQWTDVGNQRAREKTSQALREGAPELRKEQQQQQQQQATTVLPPPPQVTPYVLYVPVAARPYVPLPTTTTSLHSTINKRPNPSSTPALPRIKLIKQRRLSSSSTNNE